MTPTELLTKMERLLSDPKKWGKNSFAVDTQGHQVQPGDTRATCWCLLGAQAKVEPELNSSLGKRVMSILNAAVPDESKRESGAVALLFNDHPATTHDDVMQLIARAKTLSLEMA